MSKKAKIAEDVVQLAFPKTKSVMSILRWFLGDNDAEVERVNFEEMDNELLALGRLVPLMQEDLERLSQELEDVRTQLESQGKQIEELSPAQKIETLRSLRKTLIEATGEEKREVAIRLIAKQFDGRLGKYSFRQYWLEQILSMTNHEILVLRMLGNFVLCEGRNKLRELNFNNAASLRNSIEIGHNVFTSHFEFNNNSLEHKYSKSEIAVISETLLQLSQKYSHRVEKSAIPITNSPNTVFYLYELTPIGHELVASMR